jgi:hypothetical protein
MSRDRCATRVWCRPGLASRLCGYHCPRVPAGPPRALAPATGVVSVCARIKLRTATVLVCNLLADVVSPRPQPAGHVVCLCAHENSPGYRYGLCNLLAS